MLSKNSEHFWIFVEKPVSYIALATSIAMVIHSHSLIRKNSYSWAISPLTKSCQASASADHITSTGHNIKWDHFEILATGRSDIHCRMKESLLIWDLKPSLNENVGSEKLLLY